MSGLRAWVAGAALIVGLIGCGSDDGVQPHRAPCDAVQLNYPGGIETLAESDPGIDRDHLVDLVVFGYGHIEPDRLTARQRADLQVMLDTAERGRSAVLPAAARDEALAAYRRFRSSLHC